jgi:phospholipase/lecithinase/hemolysin
MRSNFSAKPAISHVVIMGDSLSDRGTLARRRLLGVIPMAWLSGLTGKAPIDRFTNGFAWSDDISSMFVNDFIINHEEKEFSEAHAHKDYKSDPTDLSDAILTEPQSLPHPSKPIKEKSSALLAEESADVGDEVIDDRRFQHTIQNSYTLNNDLYVQYRGRDFVRSYDEGGLTAHDYAGNPSTSIGRFVSRIILSTLEKKRKALIDHDHQLEVSAAQKRQTLIIEWSGANDLITVNAKPSNKEADLAIQARVENVEKLVKHGYQHFILFNLPDLSLTPRFQNMKGKSRTAARQNAQAVCAYFNSKLEAASVALQKKYADKGVSVSIYDVSSLFTAVFKDTINQTHQFPVHFDKSKIRIPLTQAKGFVDKDHLSPATGFMFWDDVHPSAEMHLLLANEFYKNNSQHYLHSAPKAETPEMLCKAFKKKYSEIYRNNLYSTYGFFRSSNLPKIDYANAKEAVAKILKHALEDDGKRTRAAITALQWIDAKGNINIKIPALKAAKEELTAMHSRPTIPRV